MIGDVINVLLAVAACAGVFFVAWWFVRRL
jgi:hypothetical protein